jgi:hypothetical protein
VAPQVEVGEVAQVAAPRPPVPLAGDEQGVEAGVDHGGAQLREARVALVESRDDHADTPSSTVEWPGARCGRRRAHRRRGRPRRRRAVDDRRVDPAADLHAVVEHVAVGGAALALAAPERAARARVVDGDVGVGAGREGPLVRVEVERAAGRRATRSTTSARRVRRPSATAVISSGSRASSPGWPGGASRKSSRPPSRPREGGVVGGDDVERAVGERRPERVAVGAERIGGLITPKVPARARSSSVQKR